MGGGRKGGGEEGGQVGREEGRKERMWREKEEWEGREEGGDSVMVSKIILEICIPLDSFLSGHIN